MAFVDANIAAIESRLHAPCLARIPFQKAGECMVERIAQQISIATLLQA
jgi:hypothetical protein